MKKERRRWDTRTHSHLGTIPSTASTAEEEHVEQARGERSGLRPMAVVPGGDDRCGPGDPARRHLARVRRRWRCAHPSSWARRVAGGSVALVAVVVLLLLLPLLVIVGVLPALVARLHPRFLRFLLRAALVLLGPVGSAGGYAGRRGQTWRAIRTVAGDAERALRRGGVARQRFEQMMRDLDGTW
jgi:hypothetical protein